jgi:hypothetical protein
MARRPVARCAGQTQRPVVYPIAAPVCPAGLPQNTAHRRHLVLQGTLCYALRQPFTDIAFDMPRLKLPHPADLHILRHHQTFAKPLRQPDAVVNRFMTAACLSRQTAISCSSIPILSPFHDCLKSITQH